MKKKTVHESHILSTNRNPDQKRDQPAQSATAPGGSLLKKNEFTLIILAALVVTAVVFFFFFIGPSTQKKEEALPVPVKQAEPIAPGFEDRIAALEISMAKLASSSDQLEGQGASRVASDLDQRITRIEAAVNLKLDTLIERVGKLERRVSKLAAAAASPPAKPAVKPKVAVKTPAVAKPAPTPQKKPKTAKKTTLKPKTSGQFHTVQKGETLWSISQKYKTTVAAIRKLNNMTPEDKIYPGSNLLVK